jgi:chromate transport protein ChrA
MSFANTGHTMRTFGMMMLRGSAVTVLFFCVILTGLILRDRNWYPERFDLMVSISSSILGTCSTLSSLFVGVRFNSDFAKSAFPDAHYLEITLGSILAMVGIVWISHVTSDTWQYIALYAFIILGTNFLPSAKPKGVR